jgi:hypothetical protein
VVGDHHKSIWKVALKPPVWCPLQLPRDRSIPTDSNDGGCPPLCQGCNEDAERLFCDGHIGIIKISIDPVQGHTDELSCDDTDMVNTIQTGCFPTYEQQHEKKYTITINSRRTCVAPECLISPPGCPTGSFLDGFTSATFADFCLCLGSAAMVIDCFAV